MAIGRGLGQLNRQVEGRLIKVRSPLAACVGASTDPACAQVFKELKNPYFLGDEVGLTQSLGWVGAWTSQPSVYAVAAKATADVVAAVNFARKNNLRIVVKGGGHSYQGTSNAADLLLVWTRHMNAIEMHDAFVGAGCAGKSDPQPAVSIEAGAYWRQAYDAVTTKGGRYVQGGGCMTVGVAGLVLGGGFGSFSKAYGMAGASLIEAEIVTADGEVKIANACSNPDLFWALKGGGGGFGVVTRVTLKTHALPEFFGGVSATIKATSDDAYRRLIAKTVEFYAQALFNLHWGEQIGCRAGGVRGDCNGLPGPRRQTGAGGLASVFRLGSRFAAGFRPRVGAANRRVAGPAISGTLRCSSPSRTSCSRMIARARRRTTYSGREISRRRAPSGTLTNPPGCPRPSSRPTSAKASSTRLSPPRSHRVTLHVNKGLAGATAETIASAKDTAMNPAVVDAFALVISGALGQPAYPGVPGHEPDAEAARSQFDAVNQSMNEIRKLLPRVGSYVWETDFFQPNWQDAFWGENYARLRAVKDKYDPEGLFFLHHGVGSEDWSADGFVRVN